MDSPDRPLDGSVLTGISVLELEPSIASSFAAQVLRWLGATVTRLGVGPEPRPAEGTPEAAVSVYCNDGKAYREVTGVEDVHALVRQADVLISGGLPTTLADWGITAERWAAVHPDAILGSVTGFGLTGPRSDHPSSSTTTYHAGGEGYLLPGDPVYSLFPDRPPVRGGRFLADMDSGVALVCGVLAALVRWRETGRGDVVEVSGQEVEIGLNRTTLSGAFFNRSDIDRSHRGYDYGGLLEAADGWISLRPTEDAQWQSFARAIGRTDLADDPRFATRKARDQNGTELTAALVDWTRPRTRAEIREVLLEAECPGGVFLSPAELLEDPPLIERDLFAPVAGGRAPSRLFTLWEGENDPPGRERSPLGRDGRGPLSGMVVVDLCWVAAGPYATELLAFMGATVIKVESPTRPDLFRRLASADDSDLDSSIRFVDINQGKLSISLNLKDSGDRDRLLDLVAQSDMVVDNFRPGVRSRLGIGDDDLRRVNPRIVTVSLSGFGATGPMRSRPGYASVFNAESGVGDMTGYPDGPPTEIRDSNDLRAGMSACAAGLAGLYHSTVTGNPVSADIAAREALVALMGDSVLEASWGQDPTREANALHEHTPHGVFPARDGKWVAVTVRSDDEWQNLTGVVPALADDSWTTELARHVDRARIEALLGDWIVDRAGTAAVDALGEAGVPAALSMAASDLRGDEHLNRRQMFRAWEHPVLGPVTLIGSPIRFWAEPATALRPGPPLLGQDTETVLGSVPHSTVRQH